MTHITRFALLTGAILSAATPAAAQDQQQWLHDVQAQVEAAGAALAQGLAPLPGRLQIDRDRQKADRARRKADRDRQSLGPEYTEPFSKTVRLGPKGTLDLTTISGDVVISAGGGDEVKIDATKRVHGVNEADARAALMELAVQVNERPGLLEVRTEFPRRGTFVNVPAGARSPLSRSGWSVDYTIKVPAATSLTLHTISGDVQVTGVKGDINTNTVSGDVTLSGTQARALEIETVSGDLHLTGTESERVELRAVSGDIDYTGRLARNGRYDMQSHSGDIRIVAPESAGFDIEASTFSGDIQSEYPLTIRGGSGNSLVNRGGPGHTVRGSFGDASAILTLRSFSGSITLNKK